MVFSSPLRATLAALTAHIVAISTAPSFTVKPSTSDVDVDLGNLDGTTTIVNTGDDILKPLSDPRGTLGSFHDNTLAITDTGGSRPSFGNVQIDHKFTHATDLEDHSVFTVLAPGDSIDVTHDPSTTYGFTRSSTGGYSVDVDADSIHKDLHTTFEGIAKVERSGDLTTPWHIHDKRGNKYTDCSANQQAEIVAAGKLAQEAVADAYAYLKRVDFGSERYTKWFGSYNVARKKIVLKTFKRIRKNTNFLSSTYDCSRCEKDGYHKAAGNPIIAYVLGRTINLCPYFWDISLSGPDPDSKARSLVHESTHLWENAVRGAIARDDWYGPKKCAEAAAKIPAFAIKNADNLAHFAVNIPGLP